MFGMKLQTAFFLLQVVYKSEQDRSDNYILYFL